MQVRSIRNITFLLFLAGVFGSCSSSAPAADPTPPLPGQLSVQSNDDTQIAYEEIANADPREARLAQTIALLLKSQHVRNQDIDDALSLRSFESFLEAMDPDKLFLLEEDVALFRKSSTNLDDEILSGNLKLAHQASKRFAQRLSQVEKIVAKHLASPFSFTTEEWRETDSDKISYAKNENELADRWRKLLKLEVLGRVSRMAFRAKGLKKSLSEEKEKSRKTKPKGEQAEAVQKKLTSLNKALAKIPTTVVAKIAKAQSDLATSYSARFIRLADVDSLTPAARFLNAIASNFDPHTVYLPPTEKENFDIAMSGTLTGIGAVLMEKDHFIGVNEVVPGGASWRQGDLEAGDLILSVTQEGKDTIDIGDMKINKVVKMIRGPKDTVVTLTVEKDDGSIKTISITRDRVEIAAGYAQGAVLRLKGGQKVGYIYLPSFYGDTRGRDPRGRNSAKDVKALLSKFSAQNITGVIMDVRNNGGGLLDDSRKMTGFFIEEGPVVQTLLPDGTLEVLADTDPSIVFGGKVVVLVDRFSASASEILAAALQDYGRAIIVGPGPTHGKGTVQALLNLNRTNTSEQDLDMGVLKLTVQQFFRVDGGSTQRKGVTPDIGFPDSFKHLKTGERNLDNALPWSSVKKQPFTPWPKPLDKQHLLLLSEARQARSDFFQSQVRRGELLKKRQNETRISLKKTTYDSRVKSQNDEFEALAPKSAKHPKDRFSAVGVKYDNNPIVTPRKRGKTKAQIWLEALVKDPVLEETLHIITDMKP